MKNKLLLIAAFALFSLNASYGAVEQVFNSSGSGTTSATAFIPEGNGIAEVTDINWRLDQGVTTGTIGEYVGAREYAVTSATAANASVLWFTNSDTAVAVYEFIIFLDESTGTYYLRRVSAATTTSITLYSAINITTTTSDKLWSTLATVEKPVNQSLTATAARSSIWFPAKVPTALVIDGNTTSCRISVNGVRGNRQ